MRLLVVAISIMAMMTTAHAQIRIIPRAKIDSARNVATTDVGMRFVGGATLNFGTIAEDSGAWHGEIEWRNVGEKPITITRISTSCGCLKAESETIEPTARGRRNKLQITYFPRGHAGEVSQRIFIYTDRSGQRPAAVVTLCGRVRATADRSGDYAESCGALLLGRKWVRFENEGVQTERIACMNGGRNVRIVPGSYYRIFGVVFSPPQDSANCMHIRSFSGSIGTTTYAIFPEQSNKW